MALMEIRSQCKIYEVVVFTASVSKYADQVGRRVIALPLG
jgi:TFIIF-interacting CTD phosphatase-like protein